MVSALKAHPLSNATIIKDNLVILEAYLREQNLTSAIRSRAKQAIQMHKDNAKPVYSLLPIRVRSRDWNVVHLVSRVRNVAPF